MARDVKLRLYPVVVTVLGALVVALLLSRLEIRVWTESNPPQTPAPEPTVSERPLAPSPSPTLSPSPSAVIPTPAITPSPLPTTTPAGNVGDGNLRVSNQSEHPVRVALLAQPTGADQTSYAQPVHWDFAPGEGKTKGLILSLPTSKLQLQEGDVLVAFAQDGSRRYWGPYVVGKTPVPTWNAETKEWLLILQP